MIQMPESVYLQIRQHGEAAYPYESCGILIGTVSGATKLVTSAVPVPNSSPGNTRNHYQIAPLDLIHAERQARAAKHEIVGFYHSHPDHSAHWSPTDLAEAHWLDCTYVITSINHGEAAETRAFHLNGTQEDDKHFQTEKIHITN